MFDLDVDLHTASILASVHDFLDRVVLLPGGNSRGPDNNFVIEDPTLRSKIKVSSILEI